MHKHDAPEIDDIQEFEWVEAPSPPVLISSDETTSGPAERKCRQGPTMPSSEHFLFNSQHFSEKERDEWMNASFDDLFNERCMQKQVKKNELRRKENELQVKKIIQERELNPFLKRTSPTLEESCAYEGKNVSSHEFHEDECTDIRSSSNVDDVAKASNVSMENLNQLNAKLLRAQLQGDFEAVAKIEADIAQVRQMKKQEVSVSNHRSGKRNVKSKRNTTAKRERLSEVNSKYTKYQLENEYEVDDKVLTKVADLKGWDRINAIASMRKNDRDCVWCLDCANPTAIVEIHDRIYISVPFSSPLVDHQCTMVSNEHFNSILSCDSETYANFLSTAKRLIDVFNKRDLVCIFIEHVRKPRSSDNHMRITCYPLLRTVAELAPFYFKKAILDSEGNWAQNKKLISAKLDDIRKKIPTSLPYFLVSFGLEHGFAHVIESDSEYHKNFAVDIICGLIKIEQQRGRHCSKRNEHSDMILSRRDRLRELLKQT